MKSKRPEPKADSLWTKTQFANLVRYNPSGKYYARVRVKGKLKVCSLKTKSITVAKLKLADFEKEERLRAERESSDRKEGVPTFGELLAMFKARKYRPLRAETPKDEIELKPRSLDYYEQRGKALLESWPELSEMPVNKLKVEHFDAWSAKTRDSMSGTAFNHTVGLIRKVLSIAVVQGIVYSNPADYLVRKRERPKSPTLPSVEQFEAFVKEIETSGSGKSKPCANLVRFLAFGGFRIGEVKHITWADCRFDTNKIIVRGDPETGTKGSDGTERHVPMLPEMRAMLERLRSQRPNEPESAKVMQVFECQKAMTRAAAAIGMSRVTHHDLRDLFATRVIESGVDIPTCARWLGHRDGGALLMRVYAKLRDDHSQEMAKKVSFSKPAAENVVEMPKAISA